ncbi:hypothetical protein KP509_22G003600 [Ceratopteris richardii]|uniref:Pentatricopeptide repeat-containing protein n=1 Tax=Ceratopteris richardii TaxID=49495 RepID=A0A8T2S322_CERRI|nr:hypothetical protein KP509_22G003600 [Ceratopteris richardii]
MLLGKSLQVRLSSHIPPVRRSLHRQSKDLESLRKWIVQKENCTDPQVLLRLAHACGRLIALPEAKRVHALVRQKGLYSSVMMANCIMNMYGKCHSVQDARDAFDEIIDANEVTWTSMIAIYAKHGHSKDAFYLFQRMQTSSFRANEVTFISILIACNNPDFFIDCNLILTLIVFDGYDSHLSISNALLSAYSKCGSVTGALTIFESMMSRNVVSWTTMLKAFSEIDDERSIEIFRQMLIEGIMANRVTYINLLSVCSNFGFLEEVKRVHVIAVETDILTDLVLGSALIVAYGQCGSPESALRIFSLLPERNVITWNGLISVLIHNGHRLQALQHFEKMHWEGIKPDDSSFMMILSLCKDFDDLKEGRVVHSSAVELDIDVNEVIGSALVEMYGRCGGIEDACVHFVRLQKRNVLLWSSLIISHAKVGLVQDALALVCQMHMEGALPNKVTFSGMLSAFGEATLLSRGKMLHLQLRENQMEDNDVVASSLVIMYGRCGDMQASRKVFENVSYQGSVVMWNALISAYAHDGQGKESLQVLKLMFKNGITPNKATFACVMPVFADLGFCSLGEILHGYIVECEPEKDTNVISAILSMYGKCGRLEDALWMFHRLQRRELIAWNSILAAHAFHGKFEEMLYYYYQMHEDGVKPGEVTFIVMLEGCSNFQEVKVVHHLIVVSQLEVLSALCNALTNIYGHCGALKAAQNVFERCAQKNLISWNTIIGLSARYFRFEEVFQHFLKVQHEDISLDGISLTHALSACANLAALEEGIMIHAYAINMGIHNQLIQSALLNMYGKCGQLKDAQSVFSEICEHDVISCTIMVTIYVQHGCTNYALAVLEFMRQKGIAFCGTSFVGILSACSHAGLVDEGCNFFLSMISIYGITPAVTHFSCLVDIFGRSGQLDIAEKILNRVPVQPVMAMWMTLIGSCRTICDIERGTQLASCLFQLKQPCDGAYSLLSNMYTMEGSLMLIDDLILYGACMEQGENVCLQIACERMVNHQDNMEAS